MLREEHFMKNFLRSAPPIFVWPAHFETILAADDR